MLEAQAHPAPLALSPFLLAEFQDQITYGLTKPRLPRIGRLGYLTLLILVLGEAVGLP